MSEAVAMPWVVDDFYGARGSPAVGDSGSLRNPNFPYEVDPTESWAGSIDAVNVGNTRDTFRIRINGVVGAQFDLDPGESRTITESGVGPRTFTIFLERGVVEVPWYRKYAKELMLVSVAGMASMVIVTRR